MNRIAKWRQTKWRQTNWRRTEWRRSATVMAVLTAVLLLGSGAALAQQQAGNVFGTVTDDQNSRLPGVTVTLSGAGDRSGSLDPQTGQRHRDATARQSLERLGSMRRAPSERFSGSGAVESSSRRTRRRAPHAPSLRINSEA